VQTDERDRITRAAPIVRKFVGQPLGNLLRWAEDLGELRHEVMTDRASTATAPPPEEYR